MRNPARRHPPRSRNSGGAPGFSELVAEMLRSGSGVRFRATGKSMVPVIREGEAITVEPVAPAAVRRGEIILYRSSRGVIAHRVVEVRRTGIEPFRGSNPGPGEDRVFSLRGDASSSFDEPVQARQILGRVILVERRGRTIPLTGGPARLLQGPRVFASRFTRAVRRRLSAAARALLSMPWKVALEGNSNLTPGPGPGWASRDGEGPVA